MEDPSTARCKMQAATNISCRRSPECALTLAALAVWGVRQNMSHQTLLYTDRHALRASIPQLGCSYSTSLRGTGTVICLPTTASHQTSGASAWQSSRTFSTGTPFILGVALGLYGRRYNLSQNFGHSSIPATAATTNPTAAATIRHAKKSDGGVPVQEEVLTANFVEDIVARDVEKQTYGGRVCTRFPPEPNGYLHIGHAKSICLNFGIAKKFGGICKLRFDDTNPASEKQEYIDSIQEDVRWLGFQWDENAHYASDYFDQLHSWACAFIEQGWAYIDELSAEEISLYRGTLTKPGKNSPFRDRPVEENMDLFKKMRAGEIEQGAAVLRAKIDMSHPNVIMRDPIMYRIVKTPPHPRTQDKWLIYPSYDWAHGLSDAIEEVTHSVCTLEFNMHNELYDWFNEKVYTLGFLKCVALPRQHEFARLEMTYIVVSKRKLKRLVDQGLVDGWDDPRMPTLSGMRRRGYPPVALRRMCELIGVTKVPTSVIEFALLESCIRDVLKREVQMKLLCVLRPVRVIISNWEGDDKKVELPQEGSLPRRSLTLSRELLIDRDDFMEDPVPGFKRLAPGRKVKLRYGYTITCDDVVRGEDGCVTELRCSYDPESLGKRPPKKVAVIHWVHPTDSSPVHVRLYERLFTDPRPEDRDDFMDAFNPDSLEELTNARCESCVQQLCFTDEGTSIRAGPIRAQFERCGYFVVDPQKN